VTWITLPLSAVASEAIATFSLSGVADTGDAVELRFAPSSSATLVIKGNRTGAAPRSIPCSYEIEPVARGALENPVVRITFGDKQSMTIACDPLSDNCHADRYPTVSGTSFSMLWRIQRSSAHGRSTVTK
jgi:hypothetical protein